MSDETTNPETETVQAEPDTAGDRFAVYDDTLLRFDGPVFDSKAKATAHAKTLPRGHKARVRKV